MASQLFRPSDAEGLYKDLRRANTEQAKKERFLQYLTSAFSKDATAQRLISAMALGAETTIANITRNNRLASGRADSQTDTIIIEWEADLAKTGEHAKEQLEEYLEGNWRSGQEYRFVLIATDGIRWRKYAPDWSQLDFGQLTIGRNFQLKEIRRFDLSPDTFSEFPFFLDEVLFAATLKNATLENIQNDFGDTSNAFINSMACLQGCIEDIEKQSELKVAFEQWRRFLSVAYGRFDDSPTMFLVHTYLSVFAKLIAYSVLTRKQLADDKDLESVLSGKTFEQMNIERFVEDDFFHWVAAKGHFKQLRPMFRELNYQLAQYDFSEVKEDILKGVYQDLIDLETRHALGEYYTPDWVCERIIDHLDIQETSAFLDPACGSGSFLRAVIARIRRDYPAAKAEKLSEQAVGIDIHPLSVLIAKTTVLLALGPSVVKAKRPVVLHIYLANSLLVPRGTADLFESTFQIAVDNKSYAIDTKGFNGADDFDSLITFCDEVVSRYEEMLPREKFMRLVKSELSDNFADNLPSQLFDVYKGMKIAHSQGRDSIWKFILQNSYKPVFLMNCFDFVVGNPPWLTYADVSNGEYQGLLRSLSDNYHVTPAARANFPHLEIAAIFTAHAVNYFLKPSGKLAFVLPRSVLSADQHDNMRTGEIDGLKLSEVWDLDDVLPLFRVPSCVVFAHRSSGEQAQRQIGPAGIQGLSFHGRLPRSQIHWEEAKGRIRSDKTTWYFSKLQGGKSSHRSALTEKSMAGLSGTNAYASRFTQGATVVPRNFFFVETVGDVGAEDRDRVVAITTSKESEREAKAPWKGNVITGRTEGRLFFRTAISRNLLPFALVDPLLVVLPLTIEPTANGEAFKLQDSEKLLEKGLKYGSAWFHEAEQLWNRIRTDKNREMGITLSGYLNWQNKLTDQNPAARYLVLYTSSATDASGVVIDRRDFDHPFIVDHKTYWCECSTEAEAHYLSAYINSGYANEQIKEFQSRGLFGPRDVHKLIVKLPFPRFQKADEAHTALSKLGKDCANFAKAFVKEQNISDLPPRALGTVRTKLRAQLADKFEDIDAIVEKLSAGKSDAPRSVARSSRKAGKQLF